MLQRIPGIGRLFGKSAEQLAAAHDPDIEKKIRSFNPSDLSAKIQRQRDIFLQDPSAYQDPENLLTKLQWQEYIKKYENDEIINPNNRLRGNQFSTPEARKKEMEDGPRRKEEYERKQEEKRFEKEQKVEEEKRVRQEQERVEEALAEAKQKEQQARLNVKREEYRANLIYDMQSYEKLSKDAKRKERFLRYIAQYNRSLRDEIENVEYPDIWEREANSTGIKYSPGALRYALENEAASGPAEEKEEEENKNARKQVVERIHQEFQNISNQNDKTAFILRAYATTRYKNEDGVEEKLEFPEVDQAVQREFKQYYPTIAMVWAIKQWKKEEQAQTERREHVERVYKDYLEIYNKSESDRDALQGYTQQAFEKETAEKLYFPEIDKEYQTQYGVAFPTKSMARGVIEWQRNEGQAEIKRARETKSAEEDRIRKEKAVSDRQREQQQRLEKKYPVKTTKEEKEEEEEKEFEVTEEEEKELSEFTEKYMNNPSKVKKHDGGGPNYPFPIVPPVVNRGELLSCLNMDKQLVHVQHLDQPRLIVLEASTNGDVDGLLLRNGQSVFEADIQGRLLENYITENFPAENRMFEIRGDMRTDTFQMGEIDNPVVRNDEEYEYIEGPIVRNTFWDIIPYREDDEVEPRQDDFAQMKEFLKEQYTSRICTDHSSRDYLAWFLMQWCLIRKTRSAWVNSGTSNLDLDIAVQQHAFRMLRDIFNFDREHAVNLAFHPFIRGFIDKPETWESKRYQDVGKLYLRLPSDDSDVLATTLRSHPNTYIVRLSPTRPMTLEFIRYTVKNVESKGKSRKLQDFVVFFRMNMLHNDYIQGKCDGALVSLYHSMQNLYMQDEEGDTERQSIDLFVLVMHLMKQKAKAQNDDIYFAPVMTSFGTQWNSFQMLCTTPAISEKRPHQFPNYSKVWIDDLKASKDGMLWLLPVYTHLHAADTDKLVENYTQYLQSEQFCKSLFPSMDNFGDPGCSISKKWMIENVPEDPTNPLIQNFYDHVRDFFYNGSLWECKLTIRKEITLKKRDYKTIDKADPAYPMRQQHIWHLMRWLGINYFKEVDMAKYERRNTSTWVKAVQTLLRWMLRTGSAYPFATSEMSDNMIIALGQLGEKYGIVLHLSTSQVLGLEIRTHKPNAEYKEDNPYVEKFKNETISSSDWALWFRLPPTDFRELEYLVRTELYKRKQSVLIRNLAVIRAFLDSCNGSTPTSLPDIFKRVRKWATDRDENIVNYIFLRATTEEDLADLDPVVSEKYRRFADEWQKIRSLTVQVNAEAENEITTSTKEGCSGGANPRIDFSWLGNVNVPICEKSENWIFEQPLMSTSFLDKLIAKYTKSDKQTRFLKNMKKLWQAMSKNPSWSHHWCNVGKRGNRNKTMMMNWLGMDTINYIADHAIEEGYNFLEPDKEFPVKAPKDRLSYLTYQIFELLDDPSFDLFLTPPEQKMLAYKYPGFLSVTLSGTKPGTFNVMGVSMDNITELLEDELDLENLLEYLPSADSDIYAFPIGLLIRLYLYDNYGMHIATLKDPKEDDQSVCGAKKGSMSLNPAENLQGTLVAYVKRINFTKPVSNEYASRITALLLAGSSNGKADNYVAGNGFLFSETQYKNWFSEEERRKLEIHPGWTKFLEGKGIITGGLKDLWIGLKNIPNRLRNWGDTQFTYYRNSTHWWYQTNTLEADMFNVILKRLLIGPGGDNPEGYVRGEIADLANIKPTKIQSLLDKIQPPGLFESSLIKKALNFRKKEFGGDAFETLGEQGYLDKIKKKLGFGMPSAKTPVIGEDDVDIIQAADSGVSEAFLKGLLLNKKNSGIPFGPKETTLAENYGIIPKPPAPSSFKSATKVAPTVSAAAATGVAPPEGKRWVLPAGPMSDSSGPPFQMINGEDWKDYNSPNSANYFAELNDGFEEANQQGVSACSENGPDYIFPAFDIDPNGQVVARCGRSNWMMDNAHYSKSQFERLDPDNQKLLTAIANMAQHWCPTVAHQIKLWRWLGAGCLGKYALNYLAEEALQALTATSGPANPISTLRSESMKDQLEMLQEFRLGVVSKASSKQPATKCKKRIIFLTQMISSNILFPYVKDRKNALILAGYNPDKVVIMLGWSKSGAVNCIMTSSTNRGRPLEHEFQAEDLVNYMQYVPTTIRLKVFHAFYGGIAASNYLFYVKVLKDAKKDNCVQTLGSMKRYAVRASLPRAYQERLDRIYEQTKVTGGQVTEAQRLQLNEIQNVSILLQAKNLTAQELYLFEEIMKLENVSPTQMKSEDVAETASRLYKSAEVDVRITEAETFENLALCQRPEFVPYIRRKIKDKYPEMKISDIEAMDREMLCKTLLNNPSIEKIKLPVYLWQLDNVPDMLINDRTRLLALWDENKRENMNTWLLKNYGVTVNQMREYNQAYRDEEQLREQGLRKEAQRDVQISRNVDLQDMTMKFRQFLLDGGRCVFPAQAGAEAVCQKMNFTDLQGNAVQLCDENCDNKGNIPAIQIMSLIYKNICDPRVPLLMNDFEFILESFKALMNYSLMLKLQRPKMEKRLDKQCEQIQAMYMRLMKDIGGAGQRLHWRDVPLNEIENLEPIKSIIRIYFNGSIRRKSPMPLQQVWIRFNESKPDQDTIISFAFTVLLYISFVNGIVVLPPRSDQEPQIQPSAPPQSR